MTEANVSLALNKYKKLVPKESSDILKSQLTVASDECFDTVMNLRMRSRIIILLISFFLGNLGVDRFMLRNTSLGIIKLAFRVLTVLFIIVTDASVESLTLAIVAVCWWLADVFFVYREVQEYNLDTITRALK